jgi:hypothetical protein
MTTQPDYHKVVLEPGDEYAIHSGSKGVVQIGSVKAIESVDRILSDELRTALDDLDLDALFNPGD